MNKTLPYLITSFALLPLVALAAPAAPAGPAASAPSSEGTQDTRELVQRIIALASELNGIAGSDKTVNEKVAAIKNCEPRAAELGKAVQAMGIQAMSEAFEETEAPDVTALKQAMEVPEISDALDRIFLLLEGDVKKIDPVAVRQLDDFVMSYFRHPQPEQVGIIMQKIVEVYPSTHQCNAVPGTLAFFAEIFRINPDRIPEWKNIIDTMPADWKQGFEWSLSYARGEQGDITAKEFATPEVLDACWGAFLASGDKKYAEHVLAVACQEEQPDALNVTVRAAVWSCASFIRKYPEMKTIARTWFATASDQQKENFALRTPEEIQEAVSGKVLIGQTRKEQILNERRGKARENEATAPAETPAN